MSNDSKKVCSECGDTKPLSDFHRNRKSRDGHTVICKPCACERTRKWKEANPERVREGWDKWAKSDAGRRAHRQAMQRYLQTEKGKAYNRAKVRRSEIKAKYGLTVQEYEAILSRGCAICGSKEEQMNLDHCHSTGEVRDALCGGCNRGLGQFRDNSENLIRAAAYIEAHSAA
jgi:hypothetical protein